MKGIRGLLPHATILCANMYYVFYGIDRVNRQMNFIDNNLTRFVLLLMCVCAALRFSTLRASVRRHRRKRERFNYRALWLLAGMVLVAGYGVMLIVHAIAPARMVMRGEFAKFWLLVMCVAMQLGAIRVCSIDRAAIREARRARRAKLAARSRGSGTAHSGPSLRSAS